MQLGRGRDKISNRSAYAVSFELTPDIGPHWSSDAFSVYGSPLRSPDPLPYEWSNEQTDETPDRLAEWLPNRWSFPLSITHANFDSNDWADAISVGVADPGAKLETKRPAIPGSDF